MAKRDIRHTGGTGRTDRVGKEPSAERVAWAAMVITVAVGPVWGKQPVSEASTQPAAALDLREGALRQEALEAATRAVKDFPNSVDPLGLLGDLYVSLGQAAKGIKCWEKCIEIDPQRADSYRCIAEAATRSGRFAEAAAAARRGVQVDPTWPGVHRVLGRALIRLGKPKEAILALQREVKIAPRSSVSYLALGHAYQQLAEHAKAKDNFMTALRIDPTYTEACYGIAVACARLGQKDEAAKYREKFKQMKAEDWKKLPTAGQSAEAVKTMVLLRRRVTWTHTQVGIVYYERGRLATAEKHWLRAAALDPKDTACRHELASLYQKTRRNDKALEICEQLIRIQPENARYHVGHSVLLARMNRIDAALAAIERAIQLDPDNAAARRLRQQILRKKNR